MEKKFTLSTRFFVFTTLTLTLLTLNLFTATTYGQASCGPSSTPLFAEDFGTGTTAATNPDIIPGSLTYQATGPLTAEGIYRVSNNSGQKPEWHHSPDHTGNADGRMLVVNGVAETFYRHAIKSAVGFLPGATFSVSLFVMNVDTLHTCSSPLLTKLTYTVEFLDASNTWQPLAGSPYIAAALPQTSGPTWVSQFSAFVLPATGSFVVDSIRLTISDGIKGGCGNDFAIDDILICTPEAAPTPVEFLNITARQKGSGVSIDWSTSQELNSNRFEIEKSVDGNSGWSYVGTVRGAGNSSVARTYSLYDSRPYSGFNFYRIKQVDKDGQFKYSKTVNVKINTAKTGVTVLANPFHNVLTIDFLSSKDELIKARLIDITGKQVAIEKWSVSAGNTRKDFSNVGGLQQGMYILTVSNSAGEILYNSKVIKQ